MDVSHEAVLNEELREFSRQHHLSDREQEVLYLLVQGYTSSESISRTLEISPNTTNNHVKSILDKTLTSSKTELLATFLKNLLRHYTSFRLLSKKPKVFLIAEDLGLANSMAEKLQKMGVFVTLGTDPTKIIPQLKHLASDFILADADAVKIPVAQLVSEIRGALARCPQIFLFSSLPGFGDSAATSFGADGGVARSSDMNLIYFRIVEQCIESAYDRSRFVRTTVDLPVTIAESLHLKIKNLSYGGAFIPIEKEGIWKGLRLEVGGQVALSFQLDDQTKAISVEGQIVWSRPKSRIGKPAGFGLRFTQISDSDREMVHSYVRLNKIRNYLPAHFVP